MPKATRFIVVSDSHGDMQDDRSVAAVLDFVKDFKPDLRIHGGDLFDFRNLRRGASDEEKAGSLQDDRDAGAYFLSRLMQGSKESYFLRGNHDERLWNLLDSSDGQKRDYAKDGVNWVEQLCKKTKTEMLPYDSRLGVLKLGHMTVIHGYACGMGAAARHARVYGNCFYGHTHEMSVAPVENISGPAEARGIGCLCKIDMGYNSMQMNKLRHQQGWIYGLLFPDGTYQAFQAKNINGQFHVASTIDTY
jgi:predicted phosphodiesterase